MGVLGIWEVGEGGGPLFPKVNVKILAEFYLFGETKNVPKGIKCKINTNFFLDKGFPKGGVGSDVWEKFPNNDVFFF